MKSIGITILILVLGILAIWYATAHTNKDTTPGSIACTMEAKLCPDGSSVGRIGPNCEFAACPDSHNKGGVDVREPGEPIESM